jgi:hypothetical protein
MFKALSADADFEYVIVDGTIVRPYPAPRGLRIARHHHPSSQHHHRPAHRSITTLITPVPLDAAGSGVLLETQLITEDCASYPVWTH